MATTTTSQATASELRAGSAGDVANRSVVGRVRLAVSSAIAAILGLLPHVLHHAGPLVGAALFAGVGGSLLFGVLGFVAAIPMLVLAIAALLFWKPGRARPERSPLEALRTRCARGEIDIDEYERRRSALGGVK